MSVFPVGVIGVSISLICRENACETMLLRVFTVN